MKKTIWASSQTRFWRSKPIPFLLQIEPFLLWPVETWATKISKWQMNFIHCYGNWKSFLGKRTKQGLQTPILSSSKQGIRRFWLSLSWKSLENSSFEALAYFKSVYCIAMNPHLLFNNNYLSWQVENAKYCQDQKIQFSRVSKKN